MAALSLPGDARLLIDRLEAAGFPAYAVGGCVRDMILGIAPQDYDLCTAALPEQTEAVFSDFPLVLAGKKHGTVGVITDRGVVEITTFRTEGGYQDNRHPDWVRFVPEIQEDLARRDFTVNAMAWSPTRGFADPFGGQQDLSNGILRAVGCPVTRFEEDSLRILRGVRFAVRYRLTPETATLQAMISQAPLMDNLARERVFDELCKLLPLISAPQLQQYAPILCAVIPELAPMVDFDQRTIHHAYDLFTHTAQVVEHVPADLTLRWTALLHDIGKVPTFTLDENGRGHYLGHAKKSAEMADVILRRLKAPTALRERVIWLIDHHMSPLEPKRDQLRRQLSRWGQPVLEQLLALQRADYSSKGTGTPEEAAVFDEIANLLEEILAENACLSLKDLAINGRDLIELGFAPGKQLGSCLDHLFRQVLDETLPNHRETLLKHAIEYKENAL